MFELDEAFTVPIIWLPCARYRHEAENNMFRLATTLVRFNEYKGKLANKLNNNWENN